MMSSLALTIRKSASQNSLPFQKQHLRSFFTSFSFFQSPPVNSYYRISYLSLSRTKRAPSVISGLENACQSGGRLGLGALDSFQSGLGSLPTHTVFNLPKMAKSQRERHPLLYVALFGAILTFVRVPWRLQRQRKYSQPPAADLTLLSSPFFSLPNACSRSLFRLRLELS